jgi:hypothetical protein
VSPWAEYQIYGYLIQIFDKKYGDWSIGDNVSQMRIIIEAIPNQFTT